jgi:hypothetical protein
MVLRSRDHCCPCNISGDDCHAAAAAWITRLRLTMGMSGPYLKFGVATAHHGFDLLLTLVAAPYTTAHQGYVWPRIGPDRMTLNTGSADLTMCAKLTATWQQQQQHRCRMHSTGTSAVTHMMHSFLQRLHAGDVAHGQQEPCTLHARQAAVAAMFCY